MPRCNKCDKWGLFLTLKDGQCQECIDKARAKEMAQRLERIKKAEANDPSRLLDSFNRRTIARPPMLQGVPMVYAYTLQAFDVNRAALYKMASAGCFDVTMVIGTGETILIDASGATIAKLSQKTEIISDWINKKMPYICQFTGFKKGAETVALFLYRDDESRLNQCTVSIAKLTSYMSERRQENIAMMEKGQKLFVEEDDEGKFYVRDINCLDIGQMPASFLQMYEDGYLRAMFFDHSEVAESTNGDDKEIPYVKFYYD